MRFLVLPYMFKLLHHALKRFFKDSSVKENKQQQQKTIWADLNSFDFGSTSLQQAHFSEHFLRGQNTSLN